MSVSGKLCSNEEEIVEYEWDETAMEHLNEVLSECGKECIPKFNSQAESAPPKIDILISIVCRVFDEMKNDFIRQLEWFVFLYLIFWFHVVFSAKEELSSGVSEHNAQWIETSRKIKAMDKVSAVKNRFFKSLATQFHFDLNLADQ